MSPPWLDMKTGIKISQKITFQRKYDCCVVFCESKLVFLEVFEAKKIIFCYFHMFLRFVIKFGRSSLYFFECVPDIQLKS